MDIQKLIENINQGILWVKENRPNEFERCFLTLSDCRKTLKMIVRAKQNNPGIAAFGKSQVGKSYLISNILQQTELDENGKKTIKPYMVKSEKKSHNFVFEINPPSDEGGGKESTGVVSRFSSFKRNGDAYKCEMPIIVKTFSLADVVIICADSYFLDVEDYTSKSESDIHELCANLKQQYSNMPLLSNPVIGADDVLMIKDYFAKHLNNAQTFNNSPFFTQLALLIERVPVSDYISIFSNLWNGDVNYTRLFNKLHEILKKINYASTVYLPIGSVLHEDIKENTIMSVQCLETLFIGSPEYLTDVYTLNNDKLQKCVSNMPKSEICAVCSEVVFKIDEDFISSIDKYDLSQIADDVKDSLNKGQIQMSMLKDNDLLDFPGARARGGARLAALGKDKELLYYFLRGKVAYLFNKYNDEFGINVLLYCHHNKDNDVTQLYTLVEDWVNNNVGRTPEERREMLAMTHVSPLFHIATMFNLDMVVGPGKNMLDETETAINERWKGRFETVVNKQCLKRDTVDWVRNWTREGENFNNSYALRDYKFSGEKSGLYGGFADYKRETEMLMPNEYYQKMRKTFVENPFVKQLFANPKLSWDVASSINNDGSLYILEQLAIVSDHLGNAREQKFSRIISATALKACKLLNDFYQSIDIDEILDANIRKANGIFREMDFACQETPDFFGHLLQALQLTEAESFKELHRLIPELTQTTHGDSKIKDYELIRERCNYFKDCGKEEEKWDALIRAYHFADRQEAVDYLDKWQIDVLKLFAGEKIKRKNSAVIADDMLTLWQNKITSSHFNSIIAADGMVDDIALNNLTTCIINTAEQVNLLGYIESLVSDYVDIMNTASINEDLVADIIATTISDFVMDFGYRFLTDKQIALSKRVSADRNLPCFIYTQAERKEHFNEDEMTELLNDILTLSTQYTPAYEANYNKWLEFMYIAFVAHINVPDFDREANDRLKEILDSFKN